MPEDRPGPFASASSDTPFVSKSLTYGAGGGRAEVDGPAPGPPGAYRAVDRAGSLNDDCVAQAQVVGEERLEIER